MNTAVSRGASQIGYAASLSELVEVLTMNNPDGRLLWYRGHSDVQFDLLPSLWRGYSADEETNFTHRFRARAGIRYASTPSYGEHGRWLSLMQHYGLPTRLLDWTASPLVAAFFAVAGIRSHPTDAALWVLSPFALNYEQGLEPITPSIESESIRHYLEPAFTGVSGEGTGKAVAVMASETDLRMFVQQGSFTVHSRRTPLNDGELDERTLGYVTIAANSIGRISQELRICGFNEGDLFPDLQHLAGDLVRSGGRR